MVKVTDDKVDRVIELYSVSTPISDRGEVIVRAFNSKLRALAKRKQWTFSSASTDDLD